MGRVALLIFAVLLFVVLMVAELVTEPSAPVVPSVLTSIGPDVKIVAGPYFASPVAALSVTGVAEPPAGSVTVGVGPREAAGPPNRLMLVKKPYALPPTSVTVVTAGLSPAAPVVVVG